MWKNIMYITIGLYIWGCVGGFDWVGDSLSCLAADYGTKDLLYVITLQDSQMANVNNTALNNIVTNIENFNAIKTYNFDQAIKITVQAMKNNSWNLENNKLILNVSANELIKNKIVFEQAFNTIMDLYKQNYWNMLSSINK